MILIHSCQTAIAVLAAGCFTLVISGKRGQCPRLKFLVAQLKISDLLHCHRLHDLNTLNFYYNDKML